MRRRSAATRPTPREKRLLDLLGSYAELNGIDRSIGLRVPRMLREAGLRDIRVNPLVHAYPREDGRRMLLLDFVENARDRILEKNLIGAGELAELTAALERHLADPATLVLSSVFLQTWGRAPDR